VTLGITGLITAYVLVVVLLLSINLYSNWSWQIKACSIIAATALFIVTYLSFPPILGWPTKQIPPERFRLIAAHVQHPDKASGSSGEIYLWINRIDDLTAIGQPRAYVFPYSDAMHQAVVSAQAKMNKGIPQLGEVQDMDGPMKAVLEDPTRGGVESLPIQFYDMPDPLFPEK
jgi:hypothetical protein